MDSRKLTDWLQGVGLFALVGSLVFVGLQMRQTHEIAEATLYQMRSDAARELMTAQVTAPPAKPGASEECEPLKAA